MTDSIRDVKDFLFKQIAPIRLWDSKHKTGLVDTKSANECFRLLACSNTYGICIIAGLEGFISIRTEDIHNLCANKQNEIDNIPMKKVPYPNGITGIPNLICTNSNGSIVAVCVRKDTPSVYLYDIRVFVDKPSPHPPHPFAELKPSSVDWSNVLDMQWNPSVDNANILTTVSSCSTVTIFQVGPGNTYSVMAQKQIGGANCVCWSPRGKQIVIGMKDGSLAQFKPDLSLAKSIPANQIDKNGRMTCCDVCWLSTTRFLVTLCSDSKCAFTLVSADKGQPIRYTGLDDVTYSASRTASRSAMMFIQPWNLVLCTTRMGTETAVIGPSETDQCNPSAAWNLTETGRCALPLDANRQDAACLGTAIDFTCNHNIIYDESLACPPMPLVLLLSSDGVLCPFYACYTAKSAVNVNTHVQPLQMTYMRPPLTNISLQAKQDHVKAPIPISSPEKPPLQGHPEKPPLQGPPEKPPLQGPPEKPPLQGPPEKPPLQGPPSVPSSTVLSDAKHTHISLSKPTIQPVITPQATTPLAIPPQAATPLAISPQATTPLAISPQATTPQALPPQATTPQAIPPQAIPVSPSLARKMPITPEQKALRTYVASEIEKFESILTQMKSFVKQPLPKIGTDEEMIELPSDTFEQTKMMDCNMKELENLDDAKKDIESALNDAWASVNRLTTMSSRFNTAEYHFLMRKQPVDPVLEKSINDVKRRFRENERTLTDMQMKAKEAARNANNKSQLNQGRRSLHLVYATVGNVKKIIDQQTKRLNRLNVQGICHPLVSPEKRTGFSRRMDLSVGGNIPRESSYDERNNVSQLDASLFNKLVLSPKQKSDPTLNCRLKEILKLRTHTPIKTTIPNLEKPNFKWPNVPESTASPNLKPRKGVAVTTTVQRIGSPERQKAVTSQDVSIKSTVALPSPPSFISAQPVSTQKVSPLGRKIAHPSTSSTGLLPTPPQSNMFSTNAAGSIFAATKPSVPVHVQKPYKPFTFVPPETPTPLKDDQKVPMSKGASLLFGAPLSTSTPTSKGPGLFAPVGVALGQKKFEVPKPSASVLPVNEITKPILMPRPVSPQKAVLPVEDITPEPKRSPNLAEESNLVNSKPDETTPIKELEHILPIASLSSAHIVVSVASNTAESVTRASQSPVSKSLFDDSASALPKSTTEVKHSESTKRHATVPTPSDKATVSKEETNVVNQPKEQLVTPGPASDLPETLVSKPAATVAQPSVSQPIATVVQPIATVVQPMTTVSQPITTISQTLSTSVIEPVKPIVPCASTDNMEDMTDDIPSSTAAPVPSTFTFAAPKSTAFGGSSGFGTGPPVGSAASPIFGSTVAQSFGAAPVSTTTGPGFGSGFGAAPSTFGSFGGLGAKPNPENANKNVFGGGFGQTAPSTTQQTLFGGATVSPFGGGSGSAFGSPTSSAFGGGFGTASPSQQPTTGGFGQSSGFGSPSGFGSASAFGGGASTSPSAFGATAAFGGGSTFGGTGFGAAAPQGTSVFGGGTASPPGAGFSKFAQSGGGLSFGSLATGSPGGTAFGGGSAFGGAGAFGGGASFAPSQAHTTPPQSSAFSQWR